MERKAREYKAVNDGEAIAAGSVVPYFTIEDGQIVDHFVGTYEDGTPIDVRLS